MNPGRFLFQVCRSKKIKLTRVNYIFNWSTSEPGAQSAVKPKVSNKKNDKEIQLREKLSLVKDPISGQKIGSIGLLQFIHFADAEFKHPIVELDLVVF